MRKPIIAGNWKMYKGDHAAALELASQLAQSVGVESVVDVVLCPPYTALAVVGQVIKGTVICLGAQNVHPKAEGAFTGEIAAEFLADAGCSYVIVGHSERRQYFQESDDFINAKVHAALRAGLTPILCCGETLDQREAGQTHTVVETQLVGGLANVSAAQMPGVVIAYEPVWAIGTGKVATNEQAQEVHAAIRALLGRLYSSSIADQVRIQYGGSVKPDNASGLLAQPDIDGALVGGASLNADSFTAIVRAAKV